MLTVKLQKPHRHNGITRTKGEVLRIPVKLAYSMIDHGHAIHYPEGTAKFREDRAIANAEKAEKQAEKKTKAKAKK